MTPAVITDALADIGMSAAGAVAAAVVVSVLSLLVTLVVMTYQNRRLLVGGKVVEQDDGIIGRVQANERRSRANARAIANHEKGEEIRTDGGRERSQGALSRLWAWLPTGSEEETARDGFLSSRAEVHAVAVGFLAGALLAVTREPAVAAVFAAAVFGARKVRGHLLDARRETGYTALGFALPFLAYLWGAVA